jgi:hypothetical protein
MAYNPGGGQPPFNPQYPPFNAAPPPPPPKSGMGTGAKVALFGCLGVVVLGIIAVVIGGIAYVAMNKNSNTIGSSNTNSSSSNSSSSNRNSGSSSSSNKNSGGSSSSSKVHVDSLDLARYNNRSAGEHVSSFRPTDNPMHFVVGLSEFESGTKVRVVLMGVEVATGEKNVKVGEIERETGTLENQMDATMTLPRNWPTGTYRVDVYVNGSLEKSQEFEVEE